MDNEETMVDTTTEADDTLQEEVVEEKDESEQSLESLNDEGQPEEEKPKDSQGTSEPGWIKKRVNDAVQKAKREWESQMHSMIEEQIAPYRAKMLEDEAKELVRQGEFKSLDRAKEYLSLKNGMPMPQEKPTQDRPRNERGQYVSANDAAIQARINMLQHQADTIKERTGVDVIKAYNENQDIKDAIIKGEMDFYDVAETLKTKKRPPSPMRTPNGASGTTPNAIDSMSDEQFDRMERNIKERGARYTLR